MRAFLSHSSSDKDFVREVATALGRAHVVFDAFEFSTGDEFHKAIEEGLRRSGLFVLFASSASLKSYWVQHEIAAAGVALAAKALSQAIFYIIDDEIQISDLPPIFKDSLVTRQNNPRLAALDIRRVINERLRGRLPHFFVGRSAKMEEVLELVASDVRPIVISGLQGIGRRTFLKQVAQNHLSYQKIQTFELRPGDDVSELLLYVRDFLGMVAAEEAVAAVRRSESLPASAVSEAIRDLLETICASGTFPVIIDFGALTSDDGKLLSSFETLFELVSQSGSMDLGIATARRMRRSDGSLVKGIPLDELDQTSTQRLVRLLATHEKLSIDKEQAEAIATYVAGYPPAAAFAVDEAKVYGIPHILRNQRDIVNFNARVFMTQLSVDGKLTELMKSTLQLLSSYSPLPLEVIFEYAGPAESEEFSQAIATLIDHSFVVPDGVHYRISAPVRDSAYRAFNGLSTDHQKVAESLERYLETNQDDDVRLSLAKVLFRAISLSGGGKSKYAVGLANDLIYVTTQSYFDENYDRVIEFGQDAILARPNNIDIRRVVAQAYTRKQKVRRSRESY